MRACTLCPDTKSFGGYNCVQIHNKTKCPLLSGNELKSAQDKRDKLDEEVKQYEEDIKEQEKDITEKQNDLNKELAELEEDWANLVSELEQGTESSKEDLEEALKEQKAQIQSDIAKKMARAQEVINKSLEIAHSFENAITEAHMKYQAGKRKIVAECLATAQAKLSHYRQKRRRAIASGDYQISLSSLMKKGRVTFAQKDRRLLNKYNKSCLASRKADFAVVQTQYDLTLRKIEQQKEQYQAKITQIRQEIAQLNKLALQRQSALIQEYTKKMDKILSTHQKQYSSHLKTYNKNKQALRSQTGQINVLKEQLLRLRQSLRNKNIELIQERELISHLKSKGVETEDEADEEYSEVTSALLKYNSAIDIAYSACACHTKEHKKTRKCKDIRNKQDNLEDSQLSKVMESLSPGGGQR